MIKSGKLEIRNWKLEDKNPTFSIFCLLSSVFYLLFPIFCLLSSIFCSLSHAGWYSAELLSLGVGSRASGMGGAYTAIANDGFSGWWNPAGIVKNKGPWVAGMHSSLAELSEFNFIGIGYPTKKFAYSISVASLGVDSIPELPDTLVPAPIGFFSDRELAAFLSCAYKYHKNTEIGVNIKHINCNLYNTHATGWGVDFGISHKRDSVLLGLVIKDIGGTRIKWDTNREDFRHMNLIFGTAFCYENFIISVDIGYEYEWLYRAGIEYSLMNLLFLRAGFNESITGGAGIRIPMDKRGILLVKNISIDYAFSTHRLGFTHRISASFTL